MDKRYSVIEYTLHVNEETVIQSSASDNTDFHRASSACQKRERMGCPGLWEVELG